MKKTVVITGASDGIGLKTASEFLSNGWTVYNLSRRPSPLSGIINIKADVTNEDDIKSAFSQIENDSGQIDVLVNNAGFGISGAVEFTDINDAKRQFDVNFFGAVSCVKYAIPLLRKTRGRIINISSAASVFAIPFQAFYSASKASIDVLTRALKNELKQWGISVCSVRLGDVKTSFTSVRNKSFAGDDLYNGKIAKSVAVMEKDEQNGMPAEFIAAHVYKAAIRKKQPSIATVGIKYKFLTLLNDILPGDFVNDMISLVYIPND